MSDSGAFPRVGVNLLWLLPGRVGGSEQATMRQLSALAELDIDCVFQQGSGERNNAGH